MGKGEIAHFEQFLLYPQCFRRLPMQTRKNKGFFAKELMTLRKKSFQAIGKKEKAIDCMVFPLPDLPILGSSN